MYSEVAKILSKNEYFISEIVKEKEIASLAIVTPIPSYSHMVHSYHEKGIKCVIYL
jgi:hypothetical protein